MCAQRIQFSGPTLRPLRKWFVSFAILAVCAFLLALGVTRKFPEWLRDLGWASELLILFGGSIYMLWLSFRQRRIRFGQHLLLPQSWTRWLLDKPMAPGKSRSGH
ncbi:MAG TPA: hypothetical protein VFU55_12365 [Terracidiphilus sp.]|nr:hypothetical protein [Terracidiphilus sp.]